MVHLGPWEVLESNERRVIWQGVNEDEVLEHYCEFVYLLQHLVLANLDDRSSFK